MNKYIYPEKVLPFESALLIWCLDSTVKLNFLFSTLQYFYTVSPLEGITYHAQIIPPFDTSLGIANENSG